MSCGSRIRQARKGKFTQAELAEEIGVHETTVRRWELEKQLPDGNAIVKLAAVLDTTVAYLLEGDKITTSVDIKDSNINGVGAVGNNNKIIHSSVNGENESPMVLVARTIDVIERTSMKSHEMDAIQSMLKSGLEALELKKRASDGKGRE